VARDRAAELTALYRTGVIDLHGHFERQRADQERARKSQEEAQQRAQEEAQHATLGQLTGSTFEIVKRRLDAVQLAREEAKRKEEADNLLAAESLWLFSSDDRTGMREETISELVKNISADMVKAEEAREPFQLRDLRRTAETMLAKLGTGPNI
jgi:predicted ribosome quality control (RQC) complex YloA/Tae2 family protein